MVQITILFFSKNAEIFLQRLITYICLKYQGCLYGSFAVTVSFLTSFYWYKISIKLTSKLKKNNEKFWPSIILTESVLPSDLGKPKLPFKNFPVNTL